MFRWLQSKQVIHVGRSQKDPMDRHGAMIARDSRDVYYDCYEHARDPYWGIWPKPIGYVVSLPDWMPIGDVLVKDARILRHLPLTFERLQEYSRDGRRATDAELKKVMDDNETRAKRILNATPAFEFDLEVGLNPVGVRKFFEENVFPPDPAIPLTPALLKPYTFQRRMIADIGGDVAPLPVFAGKWRGDTCVGPVFDNMMIRGESGRYPATFDTSEDRNAFFLQICHLLINGIEKDHGHATLCANHGNFGQCLIGMFDRNGDFACNWFQNNPFLKNRAITLLFHKIIQTNDDLREATDNEKSRQSARAFAQEVGNTKRLKEKIGRTFDSSTQSMIRQMRQTQQELIALLNRYLYIAEMIVANNPLGSDPNPLNTEVCSADVEVYPLANADGTLKSVARFAQPKSPDGKTMAHLLAEKCPRVLHRLMVATPCLFNDPTNPIAYSIADAEGQTPKMIAMKAMYDLFRGNQKNPDELMRVFAFFRSLPEPQQGPVRVDRAIFRKTHESQSVFGKLFRRSGGTKKRHHKKLRMTKKTDMLKNVTNQSRRSKRSKKNSTIFCPQLKAAQ